jgi:RNA-directed DNA polymerase
MSADRLVVAMKSLLGAVGVERRGRVVCGCVRLVNRGKSGRSSMDELKSSGKPFEISKWEVWEAYRQVKANKGAPGVDKVTIEEFETDLKNNLYRIWNRMSSGSYFPPPVKAVEIPKSHGGGVRVLGVPTVADRIAQTVAARRLEAKVEPIFHPDSYGYRPGRSALDAVAAHTTDPWVLLYVKRWLAAPLALPDGTLQQRGRGTPQGSAISPVLANLFMHVCHECDREVGV